MHTGAAILFENHAPGPHHATMSHDPLDILIIDDDEADRALYKNFLRSVEDDDHHYIFHEARTGKEGLELYQKAKPDCVLLDYRLPDITGIDVLESLSEVTPIFPVVVLTGKGNEEIAVDMIKRGAQDYMAKHVVTAPALKRAISNTIDRAQLLEKVDIQNRQLQVANEIAEEEKKKAVQADKAKGNFLATMSHEIRTPMNGIIGMAELLGYTELDKKQEKYVKSIRSSGELLLTIINDILDFSKIEAQEMKLEAKPVELDQLMSEVIQLLGSRANENRVELILNWPYEKTLPTISTDPVRLRQILINIISNAVKFTKDGHVLIDIRRLDQKSGKLNLRFEISDTGIGIPEDKIDQIFNQFTQVDSSTTRKYGGTGLGLTICKKLVEMMGGTIGAESELGKGSTFWFEIPFDVAQEEQISFKSDHTGCFKDKRILIVDDYDLNIDLFSEYLRVTGIECQGALCASDALEKLKQAKDQGVPFDLVLTDYAMAKMNGETLGRKIVENHAIYGSPKLILVTAMGKKKSFDMLYKAGFSAHMFKPVYAEPLIECIQDVFSGKKKAEIEHDMHNAEALPQFGAHILVVEDDRVSQRMAKSVLGELGCTFEIAGDGEEALSLLELKSKDFVLIFMDWQMPNMDGHAAIREIRKKDWGKDLKIVALTANAIQGDREKCLEAGATDYMSKPIRIAEMIRILRKHLPESGVKAEAA